MSSGAEPFGDANGDGAGAQGSALPLSPCSPAWPVGTRQDQGTENGCDNHRDPLLGKDWDGIWEYRGSGLCLSCADVGVLGSLGQDFGRGHAAPQLCTPEPVFPVTLLHAVLCSWASALGLHRWGRKRPRQAGSWCPSEGSRVALAFQGSATQYLTWASASMWPGEFPVNTGILRAV